MVVSRHSLVRMLASIGLCVPSPGCVVSTQSASRNVRTDVSLDASRNRHIESAVKSLLDRYHTPGASIEVIRGGMTVYAGAFGLRDIARRLPADVNTVYEIGSITKQFTAAAILQLQDAGKLNIDATLATYLASAPHANEVTLRQLLTHTSGMPEYFDSCDNAGQTISFDALTAMVANKPLDFAPGSRWSYSNTGYILLGRVIEVVSGESYNHYIRAHLVAKAGMTRTYTIADQSNISDASVGYAPKLGEMAIAPPLSDSYGWSAGNLVSTAADVQKWNAALTSGRIVSASSYAAMQTSATTLDGKGTAYGMGLFVDSLEDQPRIGHTGHSCGFAAENEYFPRQNTRIIVLTNAVDGPAESIVTTVFNNLFPDVAAAAQRPGAGEDPAMTARIKALMVPLLDGRVVRSEFTDAANAELTDVAVAEQFTKYGKPSAFVFKRKIDRDFGPVYIYWLSFGEDIERLTLQIDRKTDKFHVVQFATPSEFGAKR
jgi:D-alanyl-D-alanine carboxypeptidase